MVRLLFITYPSGNTVAPTIRGGLADGLRSELSNETTSNIATVIANGHR